MSKLVNWTDELNYFLDCFILSDLGNFVLDCPIESTGSSSLFANNVPKKHSNIKIRRYYKEMILLFHFARVVMSWAKNIYRFFFSSK